jgi:hypothetical protein
MSCSLSVYGTGKAAALSLLLSHCNSPGRSQCTSQCLNDIRTQLVGLQVSQFHGQLQCSKKQAISSCLPQVKALRARLHLVLPYVFDLPALTYIQ